MNDRSDDERPADDAPQDGTDDPFAFAPDGEDRRTPGPTDDDGRPGHAPDDPFAFPADEPGAPGVGPAARPGDGDPAPTGPAAPRRPGRRKASVGRRALDDDETARVRTVAEDAAAHARAVGGRWLAVALAVLVVLVIVTTVTGGPDRDGGDVAAGERLPDFAAPLVSAPKLDREDVNLATKDGQGEAGNTAACAIRDPSVVTSCGLLARGPLVLVLFSRGVDACVRAVDELEVVRRRHPGLQTLAVSLLGRHDTTGETARGRGWTLPVAYDRDGALGQVLGAPACPLVLFVRRDGTVRQRIIGTLDAGALERGVGRLLASRPPGASTTPADSTASPATTVDSTPPGR